MFNCFASSPLLDLEEMKRMSESGDFGSSLSSDVVSAMSTEQQNQLEQLREETNRMMNEGFFQDPEEEHKMMTEIAKQNIEEERQEQQQTESPLNGKLHLNGSKPLNGSSPFGQSPSRSYFSHSLKSSILPSYFSSRSFSTFSSFDDLSSDNNNNTSSSNNIKQSNDDNDTSTFHSFLRQRRGSGTTEQRKQLTFRGKTQQQQTVAPLPDRHGIARLSTVEVKKYQLRKSTFHFCFYVCLVAKCNLIVFNCLFCVFYLASLIEYYRSTISKSYCDEGFIHASLLVQQKTSNKNKQ